jgi:sec-independent protein translocase protein TatA
MGLSIWQIALVVLIFILLFGRGKIPTLMTDLAEGIKGFKKGIKDEDNSPDPLRTEVPDEKTLSNDKPPVK